MFVDQKTEQVTVPLNAELDSEGRLELANSEYLIALIVNHTCGTAMLTLSCS